MVFAVNFLGILEQIHCENSGVKGNLNDMRGGCVLLKRRRLAGTLFFAAFGITVCE